MFESDDFDQVLSQIDFPEAASVINVNNNRHNKCPERLISNPPLEEIPINNLKKVDGTSLCENTTNEYEDQDKLSCAGRDVTSVKNKSDKNEICTFVSPKPTKRKIINSYFDHKSKRKFPGPAGLLSGVLEEPKDESICQIELLSQDIDCTPHLQRDLFGSPIWNRLLSDLHSWELHDVDSIKIIKEQALSGHLRRKKAQIVTAFVEAVDRSAIDPLIILRDATGTIKCTLHRDAWFTFSPYIVSEYCALVLQKPTVLTTGAAFKKHYLNITLSNIFAIYSSTILNEDGNKTLPDGYSAVYEEDFTVIKTEKHSNSFGTSIQQNNGAEDLFDGLDSIFSDDLF